jgi:DNA polymerase-1
MNARQPCELLLVVDGHAFAYRAFYAIRDLRGPGGEPTNAIFGFIKAIDRLRDLLKPTHLLVVWDGGLAAERLAALPEYKAQRPPMPDELERQLPKIIQYLEAAGVASYQKDGVEADDWIATITRRATCAGMRVVIASSDKDFMQLVGPAVGLFNPNDKSEKIWGAAEVRAKTGVEPAQIVDWLSLVGDSVDNIPGVPGVGTKTAAELINQFGSVNALYERLAEIKSERLRIALQNNELIVRRNMELVRLNDQLPGEFSLENCRVKSASSVSLRKLYEEWGFRSLLRQLGGAQGDLFGFV